MTLALVVWLIFTVVPNLIILLQGIFIVWCFVFGCAFVAAPVWLEFENKQQYIKKLPIKSLMILPLLLFLVLPDKQSSYAILAAYGVESIVTNDKVQELGGKSLDVLNKAMDDYLKESQPAKEEK